MMWWWRKVRFADIPDELRDRFEVFGEDVLAHALAVGGFNSEQGVELLGLLRQKRQEMLDWLRERRISRSGTMIVWKRSRWRSLSSWCSEFYLTWD